MVHRPCKKEIGTVWGDYMNKVKNMKGMVIGDWIVVDFSHLDKKRSCILEMRMSDL